MAARRVLGVDIDDAEPARNVRRSHPSAEDTDPPPRKPFEPNRTPAPFEMPVRDVTEHAPPHRPRMQSAPHAEQAPLPEGPIVIHGPGWKATIPAALLLAIATAAGTKLMAPSGPSETKLDRIEGRQERAEEELRRTRTEQDRVNAVILQRLDRIETHQGLIDSRLDDMRRRMRDGKE